MNDISNMNVGLAQAKANANAQQNKATMTEILGKLDFIIETLEELKKDKSSNKATTKGRATKKEE